MGNRNAVLSHGPGRPSSDKPHKPFRKWERAMLKRTFEDLAARSASGKSIDKDTFLRFFCNVPGMLGERLFYVFNSHRSGEIDYDEFCQGIALYCFAEVDTRVLTSRGLLFVDEIEALQRAGVEVLFGCYDVASKGLQYSTGELVYPPEPPQELLDFTSPGDEAQWAEGSDSYRKEGVPKDNHPLNHHVSLRVTPDHHMLVQTDNEPYRLVPARELLSNCSCRPAELDCAHRRANVRMLACAQAGYAPHSTSKRQAVQRALRLDNTQLAAFVELLGFWLGAGNMAYGDDVSVSFGQVKQADVAWLKATLATADLVPSCWTSVAVGTGEQLCITEPAWVAFFDAEFGGKHDNSCDRSPASPSSHTRSLPSSPPSTSTSRHSSSLSVSTPGGDEHRNEEGDATKEEVEGLRHLPDWALLELSATEMRLLIDGLRRANSDHAGDQQVIHTSSARFRDQLMHALLHCGYSAYCSVTHPAGTISGYVLHDQTNDRTMHTTAFFDGLSATEQLQYKPVVAAADHWRVSWTDVQHQHSVIEQSPCWPSLSRQRCISRVPYSASRDKRIWCVKVAHKDHLIIAQRAHRTNTRTNHITRQSQPIIVSNCRGTMEEKISFVFRMFNLKGDGRVGQSELETMLNSFVFAAESIVSGRENEVSVIGKVPSVKGGVAGGAGSGGAGSGSGDGDVGYRVFNVLQIDEEDANAGSDNEGNLPAATFHRTQPIRRQSLPHAYLMSHSTSSPANAPFSTLTSPSSQIHTPSTPPPGPVRLRGGSLAPPQASASAGKIHSGGGSLDFTSDDSGRRIQHMVDVAMRIARRSDTSASSHATSTPPVKRLGSASSSSATTPAATSHHSTAAGSSATAAASNSSAVAVDDGSDPQLTVYHFAQWIQEFPEVLQVLDLAFGGKQDGGLMRSRGGKDDGVRGSNDRDVSSALDRLHTEGTGSHLLGTLISALTSRGKVREPPSASASKGVHGRTFSVTSLISPHVTAGKGEGGLYGPSIGTDVMDDKRKKEGVEIKCQQCGWHVHIQYCYSCGKKVTLTATPSVSTSPAATAGIPSTFATNGSGPSPTSTSSSSSPTTPSSAHPATAATTQPSTVPTSASSHPLSLTLLCSTCGVLFLSGQIKNCVECGFSMLRTGQKIEPPLVKSLSWQRKQAKVYTCEGELMKVGKTLKSIVTRWYVIRDNFMYTYAKAGDAKGRPTHVLFLEGCFVEAVNHEERNSKCKYGIEIIMNEEAHKSRFLYAHSSHERQQWMEAIRYHSNVHNISDYYDIREELGVGRFSSVRMGVSKQSGKQYAIKIIDKSDIDEKEREALRTEVAVLKLLNHPHIIKCKNVFETRRQMYIVMSFVRGGDLFDRIVKKKRFLEPTAQKIMYDLLSVVHYLHLRGIVHNDLKPENIMMASPDTEDEIIIADFGLSKFAMEEERFTMAQGTLAYVSPEVLRGTGYGKEVDLWSCGVILYLLVSGSLPFDSTDREEIIEKTMVGRVPFERKVFASVSDECKGLIKGLLTIDVEKRLTCQQALAHSWFRLRWNEAGERLRDVDTNNRPVTATSASASSSAPPSPALLPSADPSGSGPQLGSGPELYYNSSSGGGADVDSSMERGDEDEEDDEEEDESESKASDVADTDNGGRQPASAFRGRFINMDEDSGPDVSPSHSR